MLGCMGRFAMFLAAGLVVASIAGCYQRPAWPPCVLEVTPECWDSGSSGGVGESETETPGPIATVTTVHPTSSIGTDDDGLESISSSGSGELQPPTIVDMTLTPNPLKSAGIVAVEVTVKDAGVAVSMTVDGGEPIALVPTHDGATLFEGEIFVFGESWNGEHEVVAIATRDEEVSAPWPETFKVEAPAAGGEVWLDKSGPVPSFGNAVDVDDQGDIVELFTWSGMDGQQCLIRRRDSGGKKLWAGDGYQVAPGDCVGEAVKFAPDRTIWALVNVYENGFPRWQLWHLGADGLPLGPPEVGGLTHVGRGLDVNADGDVLLCGMAPATKDDDDAWVRLLPATAKPWTETWDYVDPIEEEEHWFNERTKDCAFVEDRIVVVGEAWGKHHNGGLESQNRGFVVEFSPAAVRLAEVVNPPAFAWHSSHQAVAPDGKGGYVAVGYNCEPMTTPCNNTRGALRWFSLGATEVKMQPVTNADVLNDVALSPAGYAVVAGVALQIDQGFLVQAWSSDSSEPVLHYQSMQTQLQVATGIATDPVGFIVAGGYYQEADDSLAAGVAMVHPY